MSRYGQIWLEIAQQQYNDLATPVRQQVDDRIEQLIENPTGQRDAVYNQHSDQWSVPLSNEGFLFYAVVHEPPRVILLRLITGLR